MDGELLRYFLDLCETLHFGRSAERLHVSPSALTRAIQRLESSVDQELFERDRRRVKLTSAGRRVQAFARAQAQQLAQLREDLAQQQSVPSGRLRIAATVTACYSLLPRLIAETRRRYPEVQLSLTTQVAARSMQQLQEGELDFAVVPLPEQLPAKLVSRQLGRTDLVFIAPAEDRTLHELLARRPIDWSQVPMVAPLSGLERKRLDQWLGRRKARPRIDTEVGGNEGILSMVALGCGVGLVPELVLQRSPLRSEVVPVRGVRPPAGYSVGLCAEKRTLKGAAALALWQLAEEPTHLAQ